MGTEFGIHHWRRVRRRAGHYSNLYGTPLHLGETTDGLGIGKRHRLRRVTHRFSAAANSWRNFSRTSAPAAWAAWLPCVMFNHRLLGLA